MPVTSTPAFAQGIAAGALTIYPHDNTILKPLFTAGSNGTLLDTILVSSTDSTARDLQFWLTRTDNIAAYGTLTSTGVNVSNGDTVTIGGKVYTFQTSLTNVDGNVKIAASATLTLTNLINAITLQAGTLGTDYATVMTAHPTVTAASFSANVVTVMARTAGTAGNAIATIKTAVTLSWGAAVLQNGRDNAVSDYLLFTMSVTGNSGFTNGFPIMSALDNARAGSAITPTGWYTIDSNGNKLLRLSASEILSARSLTSITAGRFINIRASGASM